MSDEAPDILDTVVKILPVVVSCITFAATFLWGAWVWKENASRARDARALDSEREANSRRLEAARPFLEMQLKLYQETAQVVARIANGFDNSEADKRRFWELYVGELSMVEDGGVANAMANFKDAMKDNSEQDRLRELGVVLAREMRDSLATSWGTDAWQMKPLTS